VSSRNTVRGGAVVALSLGLASLGTGKGLMASDTSTIQSQPQLFVGPGGVGAHYLGIRYLLLKPTLSK